MQQARRATRAMDRRGFLPRPRVRTRWTRARKPTPRPRPDPIQGPACRRRPLRFRRDRSDLMHRETGKGNGGARPPLLRRRKQRRKKRAHGIGSAAPIPRSRRLSVRHPLGARAIRQPSHKPLLRRPRHPPPRRLHLTGSASVCSVSPCRPAAKSGSASSSSVAENPPTPDLCRNVVELELRQNLVQLRLQLIRRERLEEICIRAGKLGRNDIRHVDAAGHEDERGILQVSVSPGSPSTIAGRPSLPCADRR
jgi:hypothetical protein